METSKIEARIKRIINLEVEIEVLKEKLYRLRQKRIYLKNYNRKEAIKKQHADENCTCYTCGLSFKLKTFVGASLTTKPPWKGVCMSCYGLKAKDKAAKKKKYLCYSCGFGTDDKRKTMCLRCGEYLSINEKYSNIEELK